MLQSFCPLSIGCNSTQTSQPFLSEAKRLRFCVLLTPEKKNPWTPRVFEAKEAPISQKNRSKHDLDLKLIRLVTWIYAFGRSVNRHHFQDQGMTENPRLYVSTWVWILNVSVIHRHHFHDQLSQNRSVCVHACFYCMGATAVITNEISQTFHLNSLSFLRRVLEM